MRVTLREKKLKHGRSSLYLDFYPPIVIDGKETRREHLKLYIHQKPKTELEREHNKETRIIGKNIEAQRQLELQAGRYGFVSAQSKQRSFIEYFERNYKSRKITDKGKDNYRLCLNYLKKFAPDAKVSDVTDSFCSRFKKYLTHDAGLKQNSANLYWTIFLIIVSDAKKEHLFSNKPTAGLGNIKKEETKKEFLTLDELRILFATPFPENENVRRAGMFAVYTGLRFSDIEKLVWSEIEFSSEQGWFIRFRQKKTGGRETLHFSDEIAFMFAERGKPDERVFNIRYYDVSNLTPKWVKSAGIDKHITFHCFRHTFATLQLTLGTDLFTVSKMLGHKNISTTTIYAKIIDEKKKEAAGRIKGLL